jgi:hypothetical protein
MGVSPALLILAALPFAALPFACGEGPPLRTLERADVTGLPAGTAVGTAFSGSYLITSGVVTGCRCRTGSCAGVHVFDGAILVAAEQDGTFTMTQPDGKICAGGIDGDGAFRCGGAIEDVSGAAYYLAEGAIHTASGQPTGGNMISENTTRVGADGLLSDCDFRGLLTLTFEGP